MTNTCPYGFESKLRINLGYFLDTLKTTIACWNNGEAVTDIYDFVDDEGEDFYDDVDETNYDPYLGCDFYDCGSYDEG